MDDRPRHGGVDHLVAVELHPVGPVGDALPQPQQPGGGDGGHAQQILGLDGKVLKGPVEAVAQRAAGTGQQIRAGQSEAPVVPDLDAAAHRGRVQPGALPARAAESEVSTQRPGVLARIMTVRVSAGRWWPSAISIAVRRSSASWDLRWLGWRGSWACVPLPRWVLRVAPASTALRTCSGAGVQWPSEMRTPRAVAAAMYSAAPARSGARVTIRTRPSAARCQRSSSAMSGSRRRRASWAPRGPSSAASEGPSTWIPAIEWASSGSLRRAAAITASTWVIFSSLAVITVGR